MSPCLPHLLRVTDVTIGDKVSPHINWLITQKYNLKLIWWNNKNIESVSFDDSSVDQSVTKLFLSWWHWAHQLVGVTSIRGLEGPLYYFLFIIIAPSSPPPLVHLSPLKLVQLISDIRQLLSRKQRKLGRIIHLEKSSSPGPRTEQNVFSNPHSWSRHHEAGGNLVGRFVQFFNNFNKM